MRNQLKTFFHLSCPFLKSRRKKFPFRCNPSNLGLGRDRRCRFEPLKANGDIKLDLPFLWESPKNALRYFSRENWERQPNAQGHLCNHSCCNLSTQISCVVRPVSEVEFQICSLQQVGEIPAFGVSFSWPLFTSVWSYSMYAVQEILCCDLLNSAAEGQYGCVKTAPTEIIWQHCN